MYLPNNWDVAIKKKHYNIYPSEIVIGFIFNYFKKNFVLLIFIIISLKWNKTITK